MHSTDVPGRRAARLPVVAVFTVTIFLSASLLFFVQPLFAKIVLPRIGGAPAVWTTAMLFFQSALIGGYLYAHLSSRYLRPRQQMILHLGLWALALFFLPLGLPQNWQLDPAAPIAVQTLVLFAMGVGVPFGVLASNAPLIQSWYTRTDGPSADDPYFLYGASNLGSLIALLGFPLVAEPLWGTQAIGWGWTIGFLALGVCLWTVGAKACGGAGAATAAPVMQKRATPLTARQVVHWLLLAFVPSSLMLAVTTQISTDIGALPLVWVLPLALYLLTFVLSFRRTPILSMRALGWLALLGIVALGTVFLGLGPKQMHWDWVAILAVAFFAVALFAHRLLYEARPDETRLTTFYVTMAVGGALGGLFNSLLAPAVFDQLREGGLTTLLAALLLIPGWSLLQPRLAGTAILAGALAAAALTFGAVRADLVEWPLSLAIPVLIAVPVGLMFRRCLPAAALAAAAALVAGSAVIPHPSVFRDRSFFGVHSVDQDTAIRFYAHGTTVHGAQRLSDLTAGRPEPLFYYHPNGPMAQILTSPVGRSARSVGIVGQGIGSLACYRQPGQDWAFYEIDPVVDRIARDPNLFTFLSSCAPDAPTYLGDARVVLAEHSDRRFDILVIDAYSSDAVPVHLTTREAMELYFDRLAPGGILVFHISNNYYDIHKPLARSAEALGLTAWRQHYRGNREVDPADTPSVVMAIARTASDFAGLAGTPRWRPLASDGGPVWTDDHANLLSILKGGKVPAAK
ncbi:MAG: fused MFS/spermidine synthase [Rhodobacter sp.]|nr:fused MFS/spermidine synthase [Rhodobacter sp.]